jgi:tetratricopeptide (TPR) repeat protein
VDARPLTPELRQRHEARNLVAHLFRKPMLKEEVLAFLGNLKTITEPVRQQALVLARQQEHDCDLLDHSSCAILVYSGRTPEEYRQALKWAEEAYRLAPEKGYIADTLGSALYYVGKYEQAAAILERAYELNVKQPEPWAIPAYDLLYLAMAHWKMGRQEDARATLQRARNPDPKLRSHAIVPHHWREAEALIEGKSNEPNK